MTTFHLSLVDTINAAMLLPTRYVLIINMYFEMRYCMKVYLRGHQNYNKSKSKVPKKAYFIKKTWIAKSLTACISDFA